jgi:gamma-glutamylcyclotransferase (GGCT)/AIG2-like uncharacterized protein YtfP
MILSDRLLIMPTPGQWRSVCAIDGTALGAAWMYVMAVARVHHHQGVWIPTGVWSQTDWPSIQPD